MEFPTYKGPEEAAYKPKAFLSGYTSFQVL